MTDPLGDRQKLYEQIESGKRLMPMIPTFARVDGRAFSKFTKGLPRPYCEVMHSCMRDTAIELIKETNALTAYAQSDEITLLWHSDTRESQIWFDGRHSKMTSQIAALATLYFYRLVCDRLPDYVKKLPTFDARVWQVPNKIEATNVFLWREWDATKNSITMAASCYYSHKELHGKNGAQKQDMLMAKGVNWNDYPSFFKRGTYIQKQLVNKKLTQEEKSNLPPKHAAHSDTDFFISRGVVKAVNMPIFSTVTNKVDVIFQGVVPITERSDK